MLKRFIALVVIVCVFCTCKKNVPTDSVMKTNDRFALIRNNVFINACYYLPIESIENGVVQVQAFSYPDYEKGIKEFGDDPDNQILYYFFNGYRIVKVLAYSQNQKIVTSSGSYNYKGENIEIDDGYQKKYYQWEMDKYIATSGNISPFEVVFEKNIISIFKGKRTIDKGWSSEIRITKENDYTWIEFKEPNTKNGYYRYIKYFGNELIEIGSKIEESILYDHKEKKIWKLYSDNKKEEVGKIISERDINNRILRFLEIYNNNTAKEYIINYLNESDALKFIGEQG